MAARKLARSHARTLARSGLWRWRAVCLEPLCSRPPTSCSASQQAASHVLHETGVALGERLTESRVVRGSGSGAGQRRLQAHGASCRYRMPHLAAICFFLRCQALPNLMHLVRSLAHQAEASMCARTGRNLIIRQRA